MVRGNTSGQCRQTDRVGSIDHNAFSDGNSITDLDVGAIAQPKSNGTPLEGLTSGLDVHDRLTTVVDDRRLWHNGRFVAPARLNHHVSEHPQPEETFRIRNFIADGDGSRVRIDNGPNKDQSAVAGPVDGKDPVRIGTEPKLRSISIAPLWQDRILTRLHR